MNWKLLAGRLRDAWLDYPAARRRIAAVPHGPPIFLTGTHRSGTTWLAGMLAASGILYSHEPTSPRKGRWPRVFDFRLATDADPELDRLFADVLGGGFRAALNVPNADHPLMPLRLLRSPCDRVLIKDPLACLLTAYLTERFGLQTLILFRHPAGFAASVCRLGWPRGGFLRQFLADERLLKAHLEPYRALLERHAGEDSIASATVLHGALNTVLWGFVEAGIGVAVSFEKLCADPLNELHALFGTLGLPYDDAVLAAHRAACFRKQQAIDTYRTHEINRNSVAMASAWKTQLSKAEVEEIRRLWECFEVPLYRGLADWDLQTVGSSRDLAG